MWLINLSDNKQSNNKLSNNKLSDNNLASELVEKKTFLNQSQARKSQIFVIKRVPKLSESKPSGKTYRHSVPFGFQLKFRDFFAYW